MSKAEILAELPKLSVRHREEILAHLCRLDEASGPSEQEKNLLDEAQSAYTANPSVGSPWSEVEARLRKRP